MIKKIKLVLYCTVCYKKLKKIPKGFMESLDPKLLIHPECKKSETDVT